MNSKWLDIMGLIISLFGIVVLALGLIIPTKGALKIGVSRISEDDNDKNTELPHVHDRVREARFALIGVIIIAIGFVLQILGSWPIY